MMWENVSATSKKIYSNDLLELQIISSSQL